MCGLVRRIGSVRGNDGRRSQGAANVLLATSIAAIVIDDITAATVEVGRSTCKIVRIYTNTVDIAPIIGSSDIGWEEVGGAIVLVIVVDVVVYEHNRTCCSYSLAMIGCQRAALLSSLHVTIALISSTINATITTKGGGGGIWRTACHGGKGERMMASVEALSLL